MSLIKKKSIIHIMKKLNFISFVQQNHSTVQILITFFIFILTYSYVGTPLQIGIDPSFQFALNYFFEHNLQTGEDIFVPYGPFGFLLYPKPVGNNILIASLLSGIFKILFIYTTLHLYNIAKKKIVFYSYAALLILTSIIVLTIKIDNLLFFICLELILLYELTHKKIFIILSSLLVALSLTITASIGIPSILILLAYLSFIFFKYKNITVVLLSILIVFFSFLTIWFLLYGNLFGLVEYFLAMLEFSNGNSSAMTINPTNNWLIFLIFFTSFLVIPFVFKDKYIHLLYFMMLLPIAVYFKYTMSRLDHIYLFLIFLFQYLFILFLTVKKIHMKEIMLLFIIFLSFSLFASVTPYTNQVSKYYNPPNFNKLLNIPLLNYKSFNKDLIKKSDSFLKSKKLDKEVLSIINNKSIDIYPWELSYIAANKLTWAPRPVVQSYFSFTPFFDNKNADFYKSENRPEFIIWDKKGNDETESIDGRYLLNDEPLTYYQIMNHYQISYENDSFFLLKKSKNEMLNHPIIIDSKNYKFNTWININDTIDYNENILRGKIYIERSSIQKIKKLIYKEFNVSIYYKFKNGREKKYRLVLDNAKNGVLINQFQRKLFKYSPENEVVAIKIIRSNYDFFDDDIKIEWELIKKK
jgi:hypothetical protein